MPVCMSDRTLCSTDSPRSGWVPGSGVAPFSVTVGSGKTARAGSGRSVVNGTVEVSAARGSSGGACVSSVSSHHQPLIATTAPVRKIAVVGFRFLCRRLAMISPPCMHVNGSPARCVAGRPHRPGRVRSIRRCAAGEKGEAASCMFRRAAELHLLGRRSVFRRSGTRPFRRIGFLAATRALVG